MPIQNHNTKRYISVQLYTYYIYMSLYRPFQRRQPLLVLALVLLRSKQLTNQKLSTLSRRIPCYLMSRHLRLYSLFSFHLGLLELVGGGVSALFSFFVFCRSHFYTLYSTLFFAFCQFSPDRHSQSANCCVPLSLSLLLLGVAFGLFDRGPNGRYPGAAAGGGDRPASVRGKGFLRCAPIWV